MFDSVCALALVDAVHLTSVAGLAVTLLPEQVAIHKSAAGSRGALRRSIHPIPNILRKDTVFVFVDRESSMASKALGGIPV